MNESIFSTYSTGENRVTASILAVLRCLALSRIEGILEALLGDNAFELIRFRNQPPGTGRSVPDGEIGSNFRLLLETKRERDALSRSQLDGHLEILDQSNEKDRLLLVITPDEDQPHLIAEINDPRLIWSNFAALNQAIDGLLSDELNEKEVISEREEFLLRELQKMLLAEKLLGPSREVLVIAARHAWPLYNVVPAYICKRGRAFQQVQYVAFYADNRIYPLVPRILERHDQVVFEPGKNKGRLGEIVNQAIEKSGQTNWPYKFSIHKVFVLSAPDAPETEKLQKPIVNDIFSSSGQKIAFTQNQRYVSLDALKKAEKTSDLTRNESYE
jgi:hypothetical protein